MINLGPVKLNTSTQWVYDLSLTLVSVLMHCQSTVGSDYAELSHTSGIVALEGFLLFQHHFSVLTRAGLCGSAFAQLRLKSQAQSMAQCDL